MYTYGFYNLERIRMEREIGAINKHWRTAKCRCHDKVQMLGGLFNAAFDVTHIFA